MTYNDYNDLESKKKNQIEKITLANFLIKKCIIYTLLYYGGEKCFTKGNNNKFQFKLIRTKLTLTFEIKPSLSFGFKILFCLFMKPNPKSNPNSN